MESDSVRRASFVEVVQSQKTASHHLSPFVVTQLNSVFERVRGSLFSETPGLTTLLCIMMGGCSARGCVLLVPFELVVVALSVGWCCRIHAIYVCMCVGERVFVLSKAE